MDNVEIIFKKIDTLNCIEEAKKIKIKKIFSTDDIYQKKHIVDDILKELREERKIISDERNRVLKDLENGKVIEEYVQYVCNKYNMITEGINLFEKISFELRKKIKSRRLKLVREESKKQVKKKKNGHYANINGAFEKNISRSYINEDLIICMEKISSHFKQLIEFYTNFGDEKYKAEIENLIFCLEFLEKIQPLIYKNYDSNSDKMLINQYNNEITKEDIKYMKCFILKIKQIYIDNIDLNLTNNDKISIEGIMDLLNDIEYTIDGRNKEDNYDNLKKALNENNYELVFQLLNNNPEVCEEKEDNKYIFEKYLEKIKNRIINNDIDDLEIIIYSKIILEMLKAVVKCNNKELKHIYEKFLEEEKELIRKLERKKFNQNRITQVEKFIEQITGDSKQLKEIEHDKLLEKIYVYHNTMKNKNYDFSYNRIITIDNNEAKLLDTAYSFRKTKDSNYELIIYVKDVNELLENVDLENMYKRFIYNKRCFNYGFTLDHMSLTVNRNYHKVLGHHFTLDKEFKVIDFKIKKEMISVEANLTYDDVMKSISTDKDNKISEMLKLYHLIGNHIIDSKRKYSLYNNVGIDHLNHNIMVFFNYYMANYCKENNIPTIFLTDKYRSNNTLYGQTPYGQYSCPARNFTSFINQLLYGIYTYNELSKKNIDKIKEILDLYATCLNFESRDSSLKKAKKKVIESK